MSEIHGDLDVALLPVWGWGPTLGEVTSRRVAPRNLSPCSSRGRNSIHWGTFAPFGFGWLRRVF
jgi:hypothetical protein